MGRKTKAKIEVSDTQNEVNMIEGSNNTLLVTQNIAIQCLVPGLSRKDKTHNQDSLLTTPL
jgi:hypothetical protein